MNYEKNTALKANKLSLQGKKPKEIGVDLKVSTDDARRLVDLGRAHAHLDDLALTPSEILLIRSVGEVHLVNLSRGVTRSPESKEVAWTARRGRGWPAATANRRLFCSRREEDGRIVYGHGLVDVSGNGYINLTAAGWAVFQALVDAEALRKLVDELRKEREILFSEIGRLRGHTTADEAPPLTPIYTDGQY